MLGIYYFIFWYLEKYKIAELFVALIIFSLCSSGWFWLS